MRNTILYVCLCGISLPLVGCAAEQRRFTGFLQEYAMLEPHPTIEDGLLYWNPNMDPTKYTAVLLEPVEVHFMRPRDERRADPQRIEAFRKWCTDELSTAIGRHLEITTEPGPNVLRCRFQVANLLFTRPVGPPPKFPPYQQDYVEGAANIETEGLDSVSGELVVAYVGPRSHAELSESNKHLDRWEAAKAGLHSRIVAWVDRAAPRFRPGD